MLHRGSLNQFVKRNFLVNIMLLCRKCFGMKSGTLIIFAELEGALSRAARKSQFSTRLKRSVTRCRALLVSSLICATPARACISCAARAHKVERSRSKGLKPALTRHSAITHQRSNGAGNKGARSEAGAANAPAASRNGGKAGNGKPVGSQLQKGSGNGKSAAQGAGQGASQGKPAGQGKHVHKGKASTRAGSAKPGAKPATQGGKPAA